MADAPWDDEEFELRLMAPAELRAEVSSLRTQLASVRAVIAAWEGATVAQTISSQAEQAAMHLDRIRTLVQRQSAQQPGFWCPVFADHVCRRTDCIGSVCKERADSR